MEQSLWAAMPAYMRKLNAALKKHTGRELPIGTCPLTFASWMGGDRDGNPNVTAQVHNCSSHMLIALPNTSVRVVAGDTGAGCYATPLEREQRCAGFCTFHLFRKSAAGWVSIGGRWGEDGGVINCFYFWRHVMSARNCSASLQAQPLKNFWLLLQSLKRN